MFLFPILNLFVPLLVEFIPFLVEASEVKPEIELRNFENRLISLGISDNSTYELGLVRGLVNRLTD